MHPPVLYVAGQHFAPETQTLIRFPQLRLSAVKKSRQEHHTLSILRCPQESAQPISQVQSQLLLRLNNV
jgi:hypothetical protein